LPEQITLAKLDLDVTQLSAQIATIKNQVKDIPQNLNPVGQAMQKVFNDAEAAWKKGEASLSSFGGATSLVTSFFTGPAGLIAAALAAAAAIALLTVEVAKTAMEMAKAADENQKWLIQLGTLAGSADEAAKISKTVEEAALKSPFKLEDLKAAALEIKKFGGSVSDTLPLVQDFAAATGINLSTAAATVSRVLQGNTRALRELQREAGISTQELEALGINMGNMGRGAVLSADQVGKLKGFLESHFLGAASKEAELFGGQMNELQNEWKIFGETIGTAILPVLNQLIKDYLKPIADWFLNNKEEIKTWATEMMNGIRTMLSGLQQLFSFLYGPMVKGVISVLGQVLALIGEIGRQAGYLSTGDFKGALASAGKYMRGESGVFEGGGAAGAPSAEGGGRDTTRSGVGLEEQSTEQQQQAQKIAELNESLDEKIASNHAAMIDKEIQDNLKLIDSDKLGSDQQKKHEQELRDLIQQRHDLVMKAFEVEAAKLAEKGADESKISELRLEAEEKLHEEAKKFEDEIDSIEKKQEKAKLEKDMQEDEKMLEKAKTAELEAEKTKLKELEELLKTQKEHQKDITDAIKEQNKEIDEQKKKLEDAANEFKKGPLYSLKDLSAGRQFGVGSFSASAGGVESIDQIMARKQKEKEEELAAHPELAASEQEIAGTEAGIKGQEQKIQQTENIDVHVDGSKILNEDQLGALVKQILDKIMSTSGNQANWKPQDKTIY
jgi:hypothetical protein